MPELPEVETLVRRLRPALVGVKISAVKIRWLRMLEKPSLSAFSVKVKGSAIESLSRRGKYLVFELKKESADSEPSVHYLFLHLRMSGNLFLRERGAKPSPYDRAVFTLADGRELRFNDIRKFGRLRLSANPDEVSRNLGPEPLAEDFASELLWRRLRNKKGAIKPQLLNQKLIAGLGNIYVDESLWLAGIHPLCKAHRLNLKKVQVLHAAIRKVLNEAIRFAGTNIGDDIVPEGHYRVRVYGRAAQPCPRCSSSIRRIVVGQRGTHFCPVCQKR